MSSVSGVEEKQSVAKSSIIASVFLTISKIAVGLATGSLGIISEAAHSALDVGAAFITYFAVRISDKPADELHHYGHGKVENLSALIEAVLLFLTCIWIIKEAVTRLVTGNTAVEINIWGFAVLIVSIIVDTSRANALSRVARKYQSQALEADALHFFSDILGSLVVLIGLIFVHFGMVYADSIAAITVALIVVISSIRLAKKTIDDLVDKAPEGLDKVVEDEVMKVPGVTEVHKVRLRKAGSHIHGDLHVVLEKNISFTRGHKIAGLIEKELSKHINDVVIHFEPEEDWDESKYLTEKTRNIVKRIMDDNPFKFYYYNLEVSREHTGTNIKANMIMPKQITLEEAKNYCDSIERDLKERLSDEVKIYFNLEPCNGVCKDCSIKCNERSLI